MNSYEFAAENKVIYLEAMRLKFGRLGDEVFKVSANRNS
jgi:hypothetical protein